MSTRQNNPGPAHGRAELAFRRRSVHGAPPGLERRSLDRHPVDADDILDAVDPINGHVELDYLPTIKSLSSKKAKENLILRKIAQCEVICNFESEFNDVKNKDVKSKALKELTHIFRDPKLISKTVLEAFINMVLKNIERDWAAPEVPNAPQFDFEEDAPVLNKEWPHVEIVYNALATFLVSPCSGLEFAKDAVKKPLINQLLDIFNTQDMRERCQVKQVLHRLYSTFICHRAYVRSCINNLYYRYMYDRSSSRSIGIAELLEISGAIINGFTVPIKPEHVNFLKKVLIPLHATDGIDQYHPQLAYCVLQYIKKDPSYAGTVIKGLVRYWPKCNSNKEVLFLNELEDIMSELEGVEILKLQETIFKILARCIESIHFQVAERALYFFNNEKLYSHIEDHPATIMSMVVPVMQHQREAHWSPSIRGLVEHLLYALNNNNNVSEVMDPLNSNFLKRKRDSDSNTASLRASKWQKIEALARQRAPAKLLHRVVSGIATKSPLPTRRVNVASRRAMSEGRRLETVQDNDSSEDGMQVEAVLTNKSEKAATGAAGPAVSKKGRVSNFRNGTNGHGSPNNASDDHWATWHHEPDGSDDEDMGSPEEANEHDADGAELLSPVEFASPAEPVSKIDQNSSDPMAL